MFQDIRDCPGPLSALTELNAAVKEKFRQLRGRIQVRGAEGAAEGTELCSGPTGCALGVLAVLCGELGVPAGVWGVLSAFWEIPALRLGSRL